MRIGDRQCGCDVDVVKESQSDFEGVFVDHHAASATRELRSDSKLILVEFQEINVSGRDGTGKQQFRAAVGDVRRHALNLELVSLTCVSRADLNACVDLDSFAFALREDGIACVLFQFTKSVERAGHFKDVVVNLSKHGIQCG